MAHLETRLRADDDLQRAFHLRLLSLQPDLEPMLLGFRRFDHHPGSTDRLLDA